MEEPKPVGPEQQWSNISRWNRTRWQKTDRSKEKSSKNEIFKITQIQLCSRGSQENLK